MMEQKPTADERFFIPFDEFIYRRITDICLDFSENYQNLNTNTNDLAVARCENIFEALMDFAADCDGLPIELKDPPIKEWSTIDGMLPGVIHPRRALDYVMRLMNELKRQQMKKGRDPDELTKKYGLGKEKTMG